MVAVAAGYALLQGIDSPDRLWGKGPVSQKARARMKDPRELTCPTEPLLSFHTNWVQRGTGQTTSTQSLATRPSISRSGNGQDEDYEPSEGGYSTSVARILAIAFDAPEATSAMG